MSKHHTLASVLAVTLACSLAPAHAQQPKPTANTAPADAEAKYSQAIDKRTTAILAKLDLTDQTVSNKVHDTIVAQYRQLRAWHDKNDAELKRALKQNTNAAAQIRASLRKIHNYFLMELALNLTPEQVEKVKDGMTYGKVKVTYDAYCEIVPGLTDAQKAHMLALLKEAREEAMDCGSSEEKSAVFNRYKGKINNYLVANGHDVSKAFKDWNQKQRQKKAAKPSPQ